MTFSWSNRHGFRHATDVAEVEITGSCSLTFRLAIPDPGCKRTPYLSQSYISSLMTCKRFTCNWRTFRRMQRTGAESQRAPTRQTHAPSLYRTSCMKIRAKRTLGLQGRAVGGQPRLTAPSEPVRTFRSRRDRRPPNTQLRLVPAQFVPGTGTGILRGANQPANHS